MVGEEGKKQSSTNLPAATHYPPCCKTLELAVSIRPYPAVDRKTSSSIMSNYMGDAVEWELSREKSEHQPMFKQNVGGRDLREGSSWKARLNY